MGKCKDFDYVVITRKSYTVPQHKMRVWKCIDPPKPKKKRKSKKPKKGAKPHKKIFIVQPTLADQAGAQNIVFAGEKKCIKHKLGRSVTILYDFRFIKMVRCNDLHLD